jgi:GNAT superfamily N-acetyltransferase
MDYRLAIEADLPTLAQMRWDFHCEDSHVPPSEQQEQFVRRCLVFLREGFASGKWSYWVASQNGVLVAHIFVHFFQPVPRPDRAVTNYGYMTNVYTSPMYRNQGIGSARLQQVIAWARGRNVLFLMVSPSERSIPFYWRRDSSNTRNGCNSICKQLHENC